jgi:hypothetical protein
VLRGPTAKSVLKLTWDYPTYKAPEVQDDGRSKAATARRALSREEALAYIAGKDPRPLLVLRECKTCNGTDDALLSRGKVDNERTFLLSRWFHCVKLPVDVLEKDHPFHNLFDEKDPEHMFLGTADGSVRKALESERSRVELWDAMTEVLRGSYQKEPESTVKKMQKLIDEFDRADEQLLAAEKRIDALLESEGPDSKKLKKAKDELDSARKQRDEVFRSLDQATAELKLRKPQPKVEAGKAEPATPAGK